MDCQPLAQPLFCQAPPGLASSLHPFTRLCQTVVFSLPALETALSHGLAVETEVLLTEAVYVLKVTFCPRDKKQHVAVRRDPTPWLL